MSQSPKPPNHETYIVNGNMTADITGDWIPVDKDDEITFFVQCASTGAPAGNLFVQARKNPNWNPVPIKLALAHGDGVTHTSGEAAVALSGAVNALICIGMLSGELRLFYDFGSGGAANTTFKAGFSKKRMR